jgi:hypothetical protein
VSNHLSARGVFIQNMEDEFKMWAREAMILRIHLLVIIYFLVGVSLWSTVIIMFFIFLNLYGIYNFRVLEKE